MADGKWIDGLRADLPPDEAARRVLGARLAVVSDFLPRALLHPEAIEHVHQLRVGTRRADAALKIFRDCLPGRELKRARKRLRVLRRAAGEARDWDVLALDLAARVRTRPAKDHPGLDHLLGFALAHRALAQVTLATAGHEVCPNFEVFVTQTVTAVRPPDSPERRLPFVELARPALAALRDELHQAASADLTNYEMLHRVRIAGKRLRYAMEIFADCFAPPFKEQLYPLIEEMQEILGRANDSHVAVNRLLDIRTRLKTTWPGEWGRLRAGVEGLLRLHQRRLPLENRRFLKWWDQWRKEGEMLFDSLLV